MTGKERGECSLRKEDELCTTRRRRLQQLDHSRERILTCGISMHRTHLGSSYLDSSWHNEKIGRKIGTRKTPIGLKTNERRKIQIQKEMLAANHAELRTFPRPSLALLVALGHGLFSIQCLLIVNTRSLLERSAVANRRSCEHGLPANHNLVGRASPRFQRVPKAPSNKDCKARFAGILQLCMNRSHHFFLFTCLPAFVRS